MSQALQLFTLNHYSLFQFKACYQGEIIADIILPNDHKLWVKGVSLGVYSRSYDFHTRTQDFTDIGRAIYEYKYFRNLPLNRKNEAISFFENKMINFYKLDEDVNSSLFDTCIAVPSNNVAGVSLPLEVIKKLKLRFDWLQNCSELLHKTREIPVIKDLNDSNERK